MSGNQLYAEAGVKRKSDSKTMLMRGLMIFAIIVGILLLMIGSYFSIVGVILIAGMVFLFPKLNMEYEYVFVDGQIDFDRITGGNRRKTILRIDLEQAEIIAPEGSHALDSYNNNTQLEKKDFSSGDKNVKAYIIIVNKNEKRYRISFEPSEKMLTMMKQKYPRKLNQY
ncbi:MAG: hypothetical protein K0S04_1119 [Herbinix sp.]|jgi:hypothetical protein|nr:hypothetical protein [Herbinix sp.]